MMYCNNTIHCHFSRQEYHTMVHLDLFKNEMFKTKFKQINLRLSSRINGSRNFFKKTCANSNALAQLLHIK